MSQVQFTVSHHVPKTVDPVWILDDGLRFLCDEVGDRIFLDRNATYRITVNPEVLDDKCLRVSRTRQESSYDNPGAEDLFVLLGHDGILIDGEWHDVYPAFHTMIPYGETYVRIEEVE